MKSTIRLQIGSDEGGWYTVPGVSDYAFNIDLRTPADAFAFTFQTNPTLYQVCAPDNEVRVFLDERRVFTGIIDDRGRAGDKATGSKISIRGRDVMGRLVDESAPLVSFSGVGVIDLIKKLVAGSAITSVVTSGVTNRRVRGGRVPGASSEPPILNGEKAPKKVEPGETIWQVMAHFLEETGYIAYTGADGKTLIVSKANHNQPPAHTLIHAPVGTARAKLSNVIAFDDRTSLGEMYSVYTALVQPPETTIEDTPPRRGHARDNPASVDGTGARFRLRKRLILQDDAAPDPTERAIRELKERGQSYIERSYTVEGHGVVTPAGERVYYAPDTMVRIEDDEIDSRADWYVAAVTYSGDQQSGQRTTLSVVPRGTELRLAGA